VDKPVDNTGKLCIKDIVRYDVLYAGYSVRYVLLILAR